MIYRAIDKPPRSADDWNETAGADIDHSITVYEADAEPVRTGLVDACGTPIYRIPERRPIGFILRQK